MNDSVFIMGNWVKLETLRDDVEAAFKRGYSGRFAFMPETVEALLDFIQAKENTCKTCNKPHEKTYGENNEWCENCVPY